MLLITSKIYSFEKEINFAKFNINKLMGYEFKNNDLLLHAITHSSLKNENNIHIKYDNEKLEFIGDAVLDLIISNFLLSKKEYSNTEGALTINRAKLVNENSLYILANKINLGELILVSASAKKMLIQNNASVLADAFEALIGAIFLDSSYEMVEKVVINCFKSDFLKILNENKKNYKGLLNEYSINNQVDLPQYVVVDISGPDHNRVYTSELYINKKLMASGSGSSIKESEQKAAEFAYKIIIGEENV